MDDCQWHTPVSHNRQQGCTRPDRKAGSLSGKITHSVTVTSPKAVCIFPNPYLPSLHLASSSMLAFSPISHCNSSRQPVQMFWDAARRGQNTTPASGLNGEEAGEEVIRHWSRTNMNSGSMSPESEETCFFCFLFFANSWVYIRYVQLRRHAWGWRHCTENWTRISVTTLVPNGLEHYQELAIA